MDEISNRNIGGPYIIPVVWHVVKGSSNLGEVSDATINQYMTYLNSKFQNALGSTSISFKLARIDKDGYCTTGINRYENVAQPWGSRLDPNVDHSLKSRRWPVSKYLNIYTVVDMVSNSSGTPDPATSAYTPIICSPTKPSATYSMTCLVPDGGNLDFNIEDGIVLRYNELSSLFHEVGHWAGLFHVYAPDSYDSQISWWTFCGSGTQNGDFINITNPMLPTLVSAPCTSNSCGSTDPKDNLMSSSTGCWPLLESPPGVPNPQGFITEQGNRIKSILDNNRSVIHSTANVLATGINNFIANSNITSNTTWTTANLPNGGNVRSGDIIINAGYTLTINSGVVITMCKNSSVIINAGAKLIMNGSTITADNPGWWNGIKLGTNITSSFAEFTANAGSTIKNAVIGVESNNNIGANYPGRVFTNGANFIDNYRSIVLKSTVEKNFGINQVLGTTFTNNLSSGFVKFIDLERVSTFTVYGSTFTNNIPNQTLALNGIAIHSKSTALNTCKEFATYSDCGGNTFSGFADGILIETPGTQKYNKIVNNTFNSSVYGVRVSSTSSGKITHNTFNLLNAPYDNTLNRFGVHITGTNSAMSIQENTFTSSQFSISSPIRTGVYHNGTGNVTKYIRKNTFIRMTHGVKAENTNAINIGTITGLTYICNAFNPNGSGAMSIRDIFPQSGTNTVSINQKGIYIDPNNGSVNDRATGNTFYNSMGLYKSIENLMTPTMNYKRRDPVSFPSENPINPINVNLISEPSINCVVEECWICPPGLSRTNGSGSRSDNEAEDWQASLNLFLKNRISLNEEYQSNKNKWTEKEVNGFFEKNSNNEISIDVLSAKLLNYYLSKSDEDHASEVQTLIQGLNKYSSMIWLLKEYTALGKWEEADKLVDNILASDQHIEKKIFSPY